MLAGNVSNPTTFLHDAVGRQLRSNVPDGTVGWNPDVDVLPHRRPCRRPRYARHLGDGHSWLITDVRDGNAPPQPALPSNTGRRVSYADTRGNAIAVREFNNDGPLTTLTALTSKYTYDQFDELLTATDVKGNVTVVGLRHRRTDGVADQSGRRPDRIPFRPQRQPEGEADARIARGHLPIKYLYDFNRLKQVDYPTLPDVTTPTATSPRAATRGEPRRPNQAGHVSTAATSCASMTAWATCARRARR